MDWGLLGKDTRKPSRGEMGSLGLVENNKEVRFNIFHEDFDIYYLPIGKTFIRLVKGSDEVIELYDISKDPLVYEGIVSFPHSLKGKKRTKRGFKVSYEPMRHSINVMNDQMDFYFENRDLTKRLGDLQKILEKINENFNRKENNL